MVTRLISHVRLDHGSGHVTHVRWGPWDIDSGFVVPPDAQEEVPVAHVVEAMHRGHEVRAVARGMLQRPLCVVFDDAGGASIDLDGRAPGIGRRIADLPRF